MGKVVRLDCSPVALFLCCITGQISKRLINQLVVVEPKLIF